MGPTRMAFSPVLAFNILFYKQDTVTWLKLGFFEDPGGIFHVGNYKKSLLGSEKFKSTVLVVKLDASGLNFFDNSPL